MNGDDFAQAAGYLVSTPSLAYWAAMGAALAIGTVGMSSAVVPGIGRLVLPPVRTNKLRDHIRKPFREVLQGDTIIRGGSGHLSAVIRLSGKPAGALERGARAELYRRRQAWLDGFAGKGLSLRSFTSRREVDLMPKEAITRDIYADRFFRAWHAPFSTALTAEHHVVLSASSGATRARETLEEELLRTLTELEPYKPKLLTLGNEQEGSALLSFWADILSPQNTGPMPPVRHRINDLLVNGEVEFDRHDGLISFYSGAGQEQHCYILPVRLWGSEVRDSLITRLLALPGRVSIFQNISVIDRATAMMMVKKRGERAMSWWSNGLSTGIEEDVADALAISRPDSSHSMALIQTEMNVFAYGATPEEARRMANGVRGVFAEDQMRTRAEIDVAQPIWFTQFPGYDTRVRETQMYTGHAAQLMTFPAAPAGLRKCDWGDGPVLLLRTETGDPYPFGFHETEAQESIGHTIVIGRTGSGKTSVLVMLAIAAMRYGKLRTFIFDRDFGCLVPTLAFGGRYLAIQSDVAGLEKTHLNFMQLPLTDGNRLHIETMLRMMSGLDDPASREKFEEIIKGLGYLKQNERTLGRMFKDLINDRSEVGMAMRPWLLEHAGVHGGVFDGPASNSLNLKAPGPVTFDMTRALDDVKTAGPVAWDLWHRIDRELEESDEAGLIINDESQPCLANPIFREKTIHVLQRGRKKRLTLVLMFQEPNAIDVIDPKAAAAIRKNTATWIFFPNAGARYAEYQNWGLTDIEWAFIKGSLPQVAHMKRPMLIKKPEIQESVIVDVDYSALGELAALFKSGKEFWGEALRFRQVSPDRWVDLYLDWAGPRLSSPKLKAA